jgi:hypothetical protein
MTVYTSYKVQWPGVAGSQTRSRSLWINAPLSDYETSAKPTKHNRTSPPDFQRSDTKMDEFEVLEFPCVIIVESHSNEVDFAVAFHPLTSA